MGKIILRFQMNILHPFACGNRSGPAGRVEHKERE
jgi:hypothetical protein